MTIKKIILKNFQAHEKSEFHFTDGVNVIVGNSDSGKTSLFRALRWVLTNRPSWRIFHKWDKPTSDPIRVEVYVDNMRIVRARGHGVNKYDVWDSIGRLANRASFSAVGRDVPDEVKDLLNFADCNLQSQFDKEFLLQDTPGNVAKQLNELVGLYKIDSAMSYINSEARQTTRSIREKEGELESLRAILEALPDMSPADELLTAMSDVVSDVEELEDDMQELGEFITELQGFTALLKHAKQVSTLRVDYTRCVDVVSALQEAYDDLQGLSDIMDSFSSALDEYEQYEKLVDDAGKKYDKCLEQLKEAGICPLCGARIKGSWERVLVHAEDLL